MSSELYFECIDKYGSLYLDYVIFELDMPILFVCKSSFNDLFLCSCFNVSDEMQWMIVNVTSKLLIDLLSDAVTIRELFEISNVDKYYVTWNSDSNDEIVKCMRDREFLSEHLPKEGELIDVVDDRFLSYIDVLCKYSNFEPDLISEPYLHLSLSVSVLTFEDIKKSSIAKKMSSIEKYGRTLILDDNQISMFNNLRKPIEVIKTIEIDDIWDFSETYRRMQNEIIPAIIHQQNMCCH